MEILDVVDETGAPTGETVERAEAHREGVRHRTAHVWIARNRNGRIQLLLQKRCMQKDSFPGCYDISSAGHIPAGEEYIPSAIRELKEELNVTVQESDLIYCGQVHKDVDSEFHRQHFMITRFQMSICSGWIGKQRNLNCRPKKLRVCAGWIMPRCGAWWLRIHFQTVSSWRNLI